MKNGILHGWQEVRENNFLIITIVSAHLLKANFAWADVQQGRSTHEEIIEKDAYNLDTDL